MSDSPWTSVNRNHLANWLNELEVLHQQLAAAHARIAELEAALQLLCDLQNGPPLIRDSDAWHDAMTKAHILLSKGQPE